MQHEIHGHLFASIKIKINYCSRPAHFNRWNTGVLIQRLGLDTKFPMVIHCSPLGDKCVMSKKSPFEEMVTSGKIFWNSG